MGKSTTSAADVLNAMYKGIAIPGIGSTVYAVLHTANPGLSGNASTSEITYTGYARTAITVGSGFVLTNNVITLAADVTFPSPTGAAGAVATHFSITTASTGSSKILHSGTIAPNITITVSEPPILDQTTAITES